MLSYFSFILPHQVVGHLVRMHTHRETVCNTSNHDMKSFISHLIRFGFFEQQQSAATGERDARAGCTLSTVLQSVNTNPCNHFYSFNNHHHQKNPERYSTVFRCQNWLCLIWVLVTEQRPLQLVRMHRLIRLSSCPKGYLVALFSILLFFNCTLRLFDTI